jgi:hypothetical protein
MTAREEARTSQDRSNSSSVFLAIHSVAFLKRPLTHFRLPPQCCSCLVSTGRDRGGSGTIHTRPWQRLQDQALLRLLLFPGEEGSPCGVLEYLPDTLVRLCGALKVLLGANLLTDILGLKPLLAKR